MRLWHYKLIPMLPQKMLVSQWRECIAIKRQWEKGTLKHRLVSYVKNYDKEMFLLYTELVIEEMNERKIRYNQNLLQELSDFCNHRINTTLFIPYLEHNEKYLIQCIVNLEEKHDREIISDQEWSKIATYGKSTIANIVKRELENWGRKMI